MADDGDPAALEHDNVTVAVENIVGGSGNDDLTGSAVANNITGGPGVDNLIGLDADDLLEGGTGADVMEGDLGVDTASYSSRPSAVTVTIDGAANDGATGEGDNVKTDVENLIGGSAGDNLTGSPSANVIRGGTGNDSITGLAGDDTEYGEDGTDTFVEGAAINGADIFIGGSNPVATGDRRPRRLRQAQEPPRRHDRWTWRRRRLRRSRQREYRRGVGTRRSEGRPSDR